MKELEELIDWPHVVMATAECWRKLTFQRTMCRVPLYRPEGGES